MSSTILRMVRVAPVKHIHSQNHRENESEPRVQFAISRYKFCYHSHARHERNKDWDKLDETIEEFQLHCAPRILQNVCVA